MAGGDNYYTHALLTFAIAIMFLLPLGINLIMPEELEPGEYQDYIDSLNNEYRNITGSLPTSEAIWGLRGIYTPYLGGAYGYTDDGWLYGTKIYDYTPSQYNGGDTSYTVSSRETVDGAVKDLPVYEYVTVPANLKDVKPGDMYTRVSMDVSQQSEIFFTPGSKQYWGGHWYYEYTGYRYSFSPFYDYDMYDSSGETVNIKAQSSSLSLIWYNYYGDTGISGNLVISGSDAGISYLSDTDIILAFNSLNNTARFPLVFNGVECNLIITIDPYYTSSGLSIEECYNAGYWSVMITSQSINYNSYTGTDNAFNIYNVVDTVIDLLTFDLEHYGFSPMVSTVASCVVVVPLYVGLISIGLTCYPILILAGILGVIQGLASFNIFGG